MPSPLAGRFVLLSLKVARNSFDQDVQESNMNWFCTVANKRTETLQDKWVRYLIPYREDLTGHEVKLLEESSGSV
jgi:hypothetical protein